MKNKNTEKQQFYKEIECTDTQNHLKECKKCSGGEWEKEFDEKFPHKKGLEDWNNLREMFKRFISKVAKTERGKFPEGYQGKE